MSEKILVFGATGNIGYQVAVALAKKGTPFRAVVHKVEKADKIKSLGENIEVVEVDITKPETVDKALHGIGKVFLLTPPGYTQVKYQLIEAFERSKTVQHVVNLAALGAEEHGGKFIWAEEHAGPEEEIKKRKFDLTSLRPSSFHSNILADAQIFKEKSSYFKINGKPVNWVSNKDIGEVAALALTTPGHEGKIYNLTGPDTITWQEITDLLTEVLGRKITYVPITQDQLREQLKGHMPDQVIDGFVNVYTYFSNGGYNREYNDLEHVLGRMGTTFREFITENKAAFQ